jgi:N-acetylneuraminic acid mutarotase
LKSISISLLFLAACLSAQWTPLSDFPGTARRGSAGFMIGDKLYVCSGSDSDSLRNDLWEYDTVNDLWSRKANLPAAARWDAVGFSIGTKGYVGTGYTGSVYKKDFWEYDPVLDSWTQKANFGGPARRSAVGFNIGDKGYIGTGYSTPAGTYYQDFWEYDAVNNVWNQKADFPGTARDRATGFSIAEKGYIGLGHDINENYYKDLWEYDPVSNSWSQKSYFGGEARSGAVGYAIGNKGFIGTGLSGDFPYYFHNDFWEYGPSTDSWKQAEALTGAGRFEGLGMSDSENGYVVTGQTDEGYTNELWTYLEETGIQQASYKADGSFSVFPNPGLGNITIEMEDMLAAKLFIYNANGQLIRKMDFGDKSKKLKIDGLVKGTYFLKLKAEKKEKISKIIIF